MFSKTQKDPCNQHVLTQLLAEIEALKAVTVRTETRLCKLIEHQGASKALAPKRKPITN